MDDTLYRWANFLFILKSTIFVQIFRIRSENLEELCKALQNEIKTRLLVPIYF